MGPDSPAADLDVSLEQAILSSEQLRVTIVAAILFGLVLSSLVTLFVLPAETVAPRAVRLAVIATQLLYLGHELVVRAVIQRRRSARRSVSAWLRNWTMVVLLIVGF